MNELKRAMLGSERLTELRKGKSLADCFIKRGMIKTVAFGWVYSDKLQEALNRDLVCSLDDDYALIAERPYTPSNILKYLSEQDSRLILNQEAATQKANRSDMFNDM